jgi:hypothetical protein
MTTFVSAFLTNVNSFRSIDKYIEYGKKLINSNHFKIIFIEEYVYTNYIKNDIIQNTNTNTIFIFIKETDLYFYDYYSKLTDFSVNTDNPSKDTIEYMFVQCNKTEWIREAIHKNPFNSEQFIWLDFGIYHVINNDDDFYYGLYKLNTKVYGNIRIPLGSPDFDNKNIFKNVIWFFLGGIFGGHKDTLLQFADIMKNKCVTIMENNQTIIWEVNIWYLIHVEYPDLFVGYHADHNLSMLTNY